MAATGDFELIEELATGATDGPDLRWVVRENFETGRLERRPDEVGACACSSIDRPRVA